jgi:hypothetical protein
MTVVYEVRKWFAGDECLYTDDRRVKDLALRTPDLRITAQYFRRQGDVQPFAWDITGPREAIAPIVSSIGGRSADPSSPRGRLSS